MARSGILMFTVFLVCLSMLLQGAFALKCWECDGNQANCANFHPEKEVGQVRQRQCEEDSQNEAVCLKIIKKGDTSVVKRECSHAFGVAATCTGLNLGNLFSGEAPKEPDVDCEVCKSDLCNGAVRYGQISLLLLTPLVIARFFSI